MVDMAVDTMERGRLMLNQDTSEEDMAMEAWRVFNGGSLWPRVGCKGKAIFAKRFISLCCQKSSSGEGPESSDISSRNLPHLVCMVGYHSENILSTESRST